MELITTALELNQTISVLGDQVQAVARVLYIAYTAR
jgi:hypothetical protein